MKLLSLVKRFSRLVVARWGISLTVALVLVGGGYWYLRSSAQAPYQFVTVVRGPIAETVSVTGSTLPVESVSLGFQNSGTIARVNHKVGDQVRAGEVLAQLNTASLSAVLQQAQAAYDSAVAARSATSLPDTTSDARDVYLSSYTTIDTALHSNVDTFFGDATAYGPQLLINASMYGFGDLSRARAELESSLGAYRQTLAAVQATDPLVLLTDATTFTQKVSSFLNKLAVAAYAQDSQSTAAQLAALSTARSSVDALLIKLSNARGAFRTSSIDATGIANASVEQAAAGVALAKANLQGAILVSPINGVVTVSGAKVGQTAAAGSPLISIISASAFEVEAGVAETNIGKVALGNAVTMTLDAFPGETFSGRVFYIEPAETVTQGVIDYRVKISFDKVDPRIKSGLTANLDIQTRRKEDVLLLPQYAILQNDEGTFVEVLREGKVVNEPVVLGIQDADGMVEMLSGVTESQQVLNIGLKQ